MIEIYQIFDKRYLQVGISLNIRIIIVSLTLLNYRFLVDEFFLSNSSPKSKVQTSVLGLGVDFVFPLSQQQQQEQEQQHLQQH